MSEGQPWWVRIERDQGAPDVMVGPYPLKDDAVHAANYAPCIDWLLDKAGGGGTDCYATDEQPTPSDDQHIIDMDNPDHTG